MVVRLNHGSFGWCPPRVLEAANAVRARLEAAPMRFYGLEWQRELDAAREAVAAFVRAPVERFAFMPNATTAVATAIAAARLGAGDEILITDHAYRACRNQLVRLADARGARIVTAALPVPFEADAAVAAIAGAVTSRTRLALFDHVTSPTAIVLPLPRILPHLRGVQVIVDGAHAPGQLDLDVGALLEAGVTWYAGNHHKWVCAPKASGFFVTTTSIVPLVTSHGASPEYGPANRLHAELDWSGTYDPAPQLATPTAIAVIAEMGGGWPAVRAHNHALAVEMAARLADALGAAPLAGPGDVGSMAALAIELPAGVRPLALERQLLEDGWEIPIVDFATGPLVRVSAHLYNRADEADALAAKLHALGVRGRRLP